MTRSSRIRVMVLTLAAAAVPAAAHAEPLAATRGTLVIGAERLFGFSSNRSTLYTPNGERSTNHTDFGLLWGSTTNLYMIPRVGADFAIIDSLTVGAAVGFFASEQDDTAVEGGTTVDADGPTSTRFLIAPRVGWVHGFTGRLGVWLRGGFTYFYDSTSRERIMRNMMTVRSERSTGLSVNLEPALTVALADHFGFSAGLALDVPLTGSLTAEVETPTTVTSTSIDQSVRNLAVALALVGWF
jgi:hypothetical protein